MYLCSFIQETPVNNWYLCGEQQCERAADTRSINLLTLWGRSDSGLMWSVTEQNHLHYLGIMFHCFGLVNWRPPTRICATTSFPPLLRLFYFQWMCTLFKHIFHLYLLFIPSTFILLSRLQCIICRWYTLLFSPVLLCYHQATCAGLAALVFFLHPYRSFCWV